MVLTHVWHFSVAPDGAMVDWLRALVPSALAGLNQPERYGTRGRAMSLGRPARVRGVAGKRGRVVVIGSKNLPTPKPGEAAYSASKVAKGQLVQIVALEWPRDGIGVNNVDPDAVIDTALGAEELLASCAKHDGMKMEAIERKTVLRVEVTSRNVAERAEAMGGALFNCTAAGQLPIDCITERVI